jgi:hypothetical protein
LRIILLAISLLRKITKRTRHETSSQIHTRSSRFIGIDDLLYFERSLPESDGESAGGHAGAGTSEGQDGLRLRLPQNEIMLMHDRGADKRTVLLRNGRRTANEGRAIRQRVGEREP